MSGVEPVAALTTKRLQLRPPVASDATAITAILNDFEISKWVSPVPFPYTRADALEFIANVREKGSAIWAILNADRLVGMIGRDPQLGFWLDPRCWGQGLMREAAQAVLAAYFKDPNAAPVTTSYMIGNTRSAALLHSLGFSRLVGVVATKSCAREALVDARQMVLTPEQWHAVNPIEIATPRMHLRPLRPADATDLARIAGNDRVAPMMASVASPWPEADVLRWIEQRRWRGRVGFSFGVYVPDGTLIGSVGLGGTPVSTAYFLDQHYWGRGLMTEAMMAFLPLAFARFALTEVTADHFADNPASGRLLQKLGFVKTGSALGGSAARPVKAPTVSYRLRRADLVSAAGRV